MNAPSGLSAAGLSMVVVVVVVVVHGVLLWALLHTHLASLPAPHAVLTVDLLKLPQPPVVRTSPPLPSKLRPPEKRPESPRPARLSRQPTPPTQLSAVAEVPALPPVPVPPAPTFVEPAPSAISAPLPVAPPSQKIVEPRFDADYLHNPKPVYPGLSRRMGEEGLVLLHVQVAADGTVGEVRVVESSASPRLNQAALDTVRRWKFVPARRGDVATAAAVRVPIAFSLKE